MARNLVVCCDGTGQEYGDANSNVVHLYSVLDRNPSQQLAFYDPGLGTFTVHPVLTKPARLVLRALGLAFGLGLTRNVVDAYRFLMEHYEVQDRLYFFGFSRGAYTVRALAAMIHKCGLLYPHNVNLIPYATRIFKRERNPKVVDGFKSTFARSCRVHFLGLWDTVTSVGWVWDPLILPYTTSNPSVDVVRHAVAIDERRAFFRQNLWSGSAGQDVEQLWFPGVHCDVGGSYPEEEAGLSKIAFEWMVREAESSDLAVDQARFREVLNQPAGPDPTAMMHRSLKGPWWLAEVWPKLVYTGRGRKVRLNLARSRNIPAGSALHDSVSARMLADPTYRPRNLPLGSRRMR